MISRTVFSDIIFAGLLVVLQIFLFNKLTLSGGSFPVFYTVFIFFYPFYRNKYIFLLLSFFLGLAVDAFLGTWGINAFATVFIAYFRTLIFRTSTESSSDMFSFQALSWSQFLGYVTASIFIHQLFVQLIEYFKFSRFLEVLYNVSITSLYSFAFVLLYVLIFRIKQKV